MDMCAVCFCWDLFECVSLNRCVFCNGVVCSQRMLIRKYYDCVDCQINFLGTQQHT